jgi:hypothetical protein
MGGAAAQCVWCGCGAIMQNKDTKCFSIWGERRFFGPIDAGVEPDVGAKRWHSGL